MIVYFVITSLFLSLAVGIPVLAVREGRRREAEWREVAGELGFTVRRDRGALSMRKKYAEFDVVVDEVREEERSALRFRVFGPAEFPFSLVHRSRALLALEPPGDVKFGDDDFQSQFRVEGDETSARATFRAKLRAKLVKLGRVRVENNHLMVSTNADVLPKGTLAATTQYVIALYRELNVPAEQVSERLIEELGEVEDLAIADRLLQLLFRSRDPVMFGRAIHAAVSHRNPVVRVMGAIRDSATYQDVLIDAVFDVRLDDAVRAQAFTALPAALFDAATLAELRAYARVRLRTAIVRRLRELVNERVEAELIAALSDEKEEVQLIAVESLAEVGTLDAVPALQRAGVGLFTSARLREAVVGAVQAIQARIGGPGGGALSISDAGDDRGAVSLSDAGALSEVKDR